MEIGGAATPPPQPPLASSSSSSSSSSEKIQFPSSSSLAFWNNDDVSDSSNYEDYDDEHDIESKGLIFGQHGNPWDTLKDVTRNDYLVEDLNLYCRKAIAQFNSDHSEDYVFKEVEKMSLVVVSGFLYYINFSASKLPGLARSFAAFVYQPHSDPELQKFKVDSCKLKLKN